MKTPALPTTIIALGSLLAAIASTVLFVLLDPIAAASIILLTFTAPMVIAALILRAAHRTGPHTIVPVQFP